MSEEFSPGPWTLEPASDRPYIMADDTTIAKTYRTSISKLGIVDIPGDANARLIAAAPDLYAALNSLLKTVVDDLGECGYDEGDIADHDGVKRATAALAKARGETP